MTSLITLRPHQIRILDRMRNYNKGQIIVPTGGETMCMIQDTAHSQQSKCGVTTVVVAPRILLAEQLCSEFLEVIDTAYTHLAFTVVKRHTFYNKCRKYQPVRKYSKDCW